MKKLLTLLLAVVLVCSFALLVACGGNEKGTEEPTPTPTTDNPPVDNPSGLESAGDYVRQLYKDMTNTASDFTVVPSVQVEGVTYQITWSVNTDQVKVVVSDDGKTVTIDIIPEEPIANIPYVLTATIADADGKTLVKEFNLTVPKFQVLTHEEYLAKKAGDAVVIEGIAVAVHSKDDGNSKNMLYVMDETNVGGYYIYSMTIDPAKDAGIKAGMTVRVKGTKDIYGGTHEVKDATAEVIDSTIKELTPVDITEDYKAAESANDASLTGKVGMLVTIKGVEITDQDLAEKQQYLKFKLGGVESYIRVYNTDLPVSFANDKKQGVIDGHAAHKSWLADVTGVVVVYNGAYLNPISDACFTYISEIERTPAEQVENEKENLTVQTSVFSDTVIDLPLAGATYSDVVISWASDNSCAVVADGKLTVTLQGEAQTVKLTATLTLGENTATKEFTIEVAAKPTVIPSVVEAPVVDTAYKLFYTQTQLGQNLYFNGTAGNYYANTTSVVDEAVEVYLEAAEGGYYIYFLDAENDNAKTYIEAFLSGTYCNIRLTTNTPESVFVIDEEIKAPVVTLGEGESQTTYFLGTYGSNKDIRPSAIKYASQGNYIARFAVMIDAASCNHDYTNDCDDTCNICGAVREGVGHKYDNDCDPDCNVCGEIRTTDHVDADKDSICDVCGKNLNAFVLTKVDAPVEGTAYKFCLIQAKLNKTLYLTGKMSGNFFATTELAAEAADVYIETVDGGFKVYVMDGETKNYINVYKNASNKIAIEFSTENAAVISYDAELGAYTTVVDDSQVYFGTYNTYNTISTSDVKYISGDNAAKVGDTQFVAFFATYECKHQHSADCDAICDLCGATREVTAEHTYDNHKDEECNACGAKRETTDCVDADGDNVCDNCGADLTPAVSEAKAVFEFGDNGEAKHADGTDLGASAEYTENGYTLALTDMSKVFGPAFDAQGNSCLKLGTGSVVATFTFTVADDVTSVVIKVAKYKTNDTTVTVNDNEYEITKSSNDGEYDEITIDTSSVKTITFATVSGKCRAMVNSITFM